MNFLDLINLDGFGGIGLVVSKFKFLIFVDVIVFDIVVWLMIKFDSLLLFCLLKI